MMCWGHHSPTHPQAGYDIIKQVTTLPYLTLPYFPVSSLPLARLQSERKRRVIDRDPSIFPPPPIPPSLTLTGNFESH